MLYRILGPIEVSSEQGPVGLGGPKQRLVLAMLLAQVDRAVPEERLIESTWGDDPPPGVRHSLQTYISELRRVLDDEIGYEGRGYRLRVDPDAVDAGRFELLVEAARSRMSDAPAGAAELLRQALALWRGEPYADLTEFEALYPEIVRLREARLAAVEDRVSADLGSGRHARVVAELEALTREHPYRERLYELHMLSLYRSGRQADALRVFERARSVLADELGIDPAPELQELHRRILSQDPELLAAEDATIAQAAVTPGAAEAGVEPVGFEVIRGFELRERAGDGDFGTVYRAYQASVGREVAVKAIRAELANRPGFVRGFEPRAQRIAELDHANVLPLLDSWRDPSGAFLVTPWVRGGSVRRALQHGPWSLPSTLQMLEQVGAALASAHRHGVVHGDVKASNVLLDADGNALVGDFSITARALDAGGEQVGTSASVPPEDRRGLPLSPASDVYALAVLGVETLTGKPPPEDRPVSRLGSVRPEIPAAIRAVLERATDPDPERRPRSMTDFLRDLRRAAGGDVVALPVDEEGGARVRNPYKGLQPFREADAADFFGREELIEELVEAVRTRRLVAVVGPSGSGKSSVVRAGLIPAIRAGALPGSRDWLATEMFPGSYPFEEMEAALLRVAVDPPGGLGDLMADELGMLRAVKQALPNDESELLLVIDQFEELFSLTTDPDIRGLFLAGLTTLAEDERSRVRLVLTLRADFFDRPLDRHPFGELVRDGLVPVAVPAPDELARAVSQPAHRVGVAFEPGLIGRIVDDVVGQPGGLPLLQHAMAELFERREGRMLTTGAYRATGGVLGALGRRAEEVFSSLSADRRRVAEQMFLRLVAVDEQTEDARRRVRRSELVSLSANPDPIDDVIRRFGAHRLLSFDRDPVTRQPTVEVAHEALFGEWGTLRGWIDGRREDLLLHRRLTAAVTEWRQAGRPDDYLLVGGRLEEFERWAGGTDLLLTEEERGYLAEGRTREDERAAGRRRRRVGVVAAAITAAVVAAGLATFALLERGSATRQAARARSEATAALAQELGAQALSEARLDRSLLLAVEGESLDPSMETYGHLLASVLRSPSAIAVMHGWDGARHIGDDDRGESGTELVADRAACVYASPGGETLVAGDTVGGLVFLDPGTYQRGREVSVPIVRCHHAAFSPDGRTFAALAWERGELRLALLDVASGSVRTEPLGYLRPPRFLRHASAPTFSPDGRILLLLETQAGLFPDGQWPEILAVARDPSTGEATGPRASTGIRAHEAFVAFAPGGDRIVVSGPANAWPDPGPGATVVLDAGTMRPLRTFDTGYNVAALAPDGGTLALARVPSEGQATLLDLRSGEQIVLAGRHAGAVTGVGFAPDGTRVVTTGDDRSVLVWDAVTGELEERFEGHAGAAFGPAFSPDGATVFTAGLDEAVIAWDLAGTRRLGRPFAWAGPAEAEVRGEFVGTALALDGSVLYRGTRDGRVVAIDVPGGEPRWDATVWSRRRVDELVTSETRAFAELRGSSVEEVANITPPFGGFVQSLALSPDGSLLAVAAHHGEIALLDPADGTVFRRWRANTLGTGWVGRVAFSSDGRILVTANDDGRAVLWDPSDGEEIGSVALPRDDPRFVLAAVPSPDGTEVAILSSPNLFDPDVPIPQGPPRVGVWSVPTGEPRWEADVSEENFWAAPSLAVSRDWSELAVGGFLRDVQLWDVGSGRPLGAPISASAGFVVSVAFDGRGDRLLTGGTDGTSRLFDVASRRQLAVLPGSEGRWTTAAFGSGDDSVLALSGTGRAWWWDIGRDGLRERACRTANRALTRAEWSFYLRGRGYAPTCPG